MSKARSRARRRRKHMEVLLDEQNNRCYYCKRTVSVNLPVEHEDKATIDHRIPRSRGGSHARSNLVAACNRCNQKKGVLTEEEYRRTFAQSLKKLKKTPNAFEAIKYIFALSKLMQRKQDADA